MWRVVWERLRRVPAPVGDAALALAVVAVNVVAIGVAREPGARPLDPLAYALATSYGILLLSRRRWPLGVLLASTAALLAYYTLGYPGISPAFPLAVALYSAALAGYVRWGLVITAFFMLAGAFVTGVREGTPPEQVFAGFLPQASLLVTLLLLGEAVRSHRAWQVEVGERLARAEAEREREAARRVEQERLRIARELHDVMAHTISVITVQAGEPRPLPPAVDLTAYRIVQESLTNVVRHAGATTATVTIAYRPDAVVLEVCDDGRGAAEAADPAGYGLVGMAERVAAIDGRLEAGPRPAGGFRVRALLPLERAR